MDVEKHNDMEGIRQLKARYFRLMDTRQWDLLEECFVEDVQAVYEGAPRASEDLPCDIKIQGRQALVDGVRGLMTGATSVHQGYMPEIELTSATTAHGIWAKSDDERLPTCHSKGWGPDTEESVWESGRRTVKTIQRTRVQKEK